MSNNIHNGNLPNIPTATSITTTQTTHKCSFISNAIHFEITTHQPNTSHKYQELAMCRQQQHKQIASSWSDLQLLYLINWIIESAENNQVLECNYAHLFVGLAYLQAHKFSVHGKAKKLQTYGFDLFMATVQKINLIKQIHPLQLKQRVFQKVTTECLNYYKRNQDQEYFMRELRNFLLQHKPTMSSFMPVYYQYFNSACHYTTIFKNPPKLEDIQNFLQQQKSEVSKKYNNTVVF